MELKDLKEELDGLKNDLAGKTKGQIDDALKSFEETFSKDLMKKFENNAKSEDLEKMEIAYKDGIKGVQDHLDKLDVRLQAKKTDIPKGQIPFYHEMKEFIASKFDEIKGVSKGNGVKYEIESKAVGNMTTGNLTGDEYREYSNTVIAVPNRLVNFVDLCGADINIGTGTYTFPNESGSEGSISTQTEGSDKSQIDYDFTHTDVTTDFLSGFAVFSKKMRNNLMYLESFLPRALRRDYIKAEDTKFNTALASAAAASSQIITSKNKIEMLMNELSTLEEADFSPNVQVCRPADWWDILKIEKSTGAGYGLPGVVTFENGVLRINGIPLFKSTFMTTNKYYVGDWTEINRVVTEGLSLEFSESDEDNFRKNNITARIEAQIGLAIHRPTAIIYGDFTAT